MDKLLNVPELAYYLSIKPQTVYQWHHLGKIRGHKIGGALRFNLKEVMEQFSSNGDYSPQLKAK